MSNQGSRKSRRPRGTGSLYEHRGAWYATWWVGGRQVKRKVGPKRTPGTRDGLTQTQAEARLRQLIGETRSPAAQERMTLKEAGDRYIWHLKNVMHRKPSTIQDYTIMLNRHFDRVFPPKGIEKITPDDVMAYIDTVSREGLAAKGISRKGCVDLC